MTLDGRIHDGVVVFSQPVPLPEGTPVRVEPTPNFWQDKSLEEIAREQGAVPITALDELVGDWPEEDSVDDLLAMIRKARH